MFYRYLRSGSRISVDLDGIYNGSSLFILGGSPSLSEMDLGLLRLPGICTLAMNNVPRTFPKPTLWVCADKPACFDQRIYALPDIMKFTMTSRRCEIVGDTNRRAMDFPNILFYGVKPDIAIDQFLDHSRDFVWWKSIFPISLQLAHRLGFGTVYLVGCGFKNSSEKPYAWSTHLNDYQLSYSQRTYHTDIDRLAKLAPVFEKHNFRIISCTPEGAANSILRYVDLETAVKEVLDSYPKSTKADDLVHSSALS